MNQNLNDPNRPVGVIELDDLDLPVPLDLPLLGSLRVDDEHATHAYVNPANSKSTVDHNQLRGDCSQDIGSSVEMLSFLSNFLLEDDIGSKGGMYGTAVDSNVMSFKLNVQSTRDDYPDNLDYSDDVLKYMRHFLLEDDVEEKAGFNENHADAKNLVSCGDQNFCKDTNNYVYFDRVENSVRRKVYTGKIPAAGSSNLISEVQTCSVDSHDDLDFSDDVLKYINHILLEGGVEEKTRTFQESEGLEATEHSLYEAMWGQYPASTSQHFQSADQICFSEIPNSIISGRMEALYPNSVSCNSSLCGSGDQQHGANLSSQSLSLSPDNSSSSGGVAVDATSGSPVSGFEFADIYRGGQTAMHLNKEVKEGKFLPDCNSVICLLDSEEEIAVERDVANQELSNASTGKKHRHTDIQDLVEERSSKQFAVHRESSLPDDMFDNVLVFRKEKEESAIREEINESTKATVHHDQSKGHKSGKRGRKKREGKKNEVDMRTLLILCAQAVAAEDLRSMNEFLRQIRQHSTPAGDGMQRLAHYFADGLEARIAGAGTQIYTTLINMPISAADLLKAYHIYLATCPHRKTSNFFSNQTILNVVENASSLHIVDFGTLYGFQWPSFLHKLSLRRGGPPRVRFTAIDFPCPGFKPSQRILETGKRLASYAEKFSVPFEFNGLAQKWETIKLEDIKINKGEVLVVNCLYRLRYLLDETVIADCPRDIVLNLIRKMNPAVFVLGIRNGGHNAAFFLTRFREALFHYSSIFDALDAVIPRDKHERMLLERVIFGREAMNALACEGAERIERPETYKQWQARIERAGMELLPLNRKIMDTARNKVKSYHKDFVIDEDGHWLLQGWKGRIAYALSHWRPAPHHEHEPRLLVKPKGCNFLDVC